MKLTVLAGSTKAFPYGREYGGWLYRNADGTYSYGEPRPGSGHRIALKEFVPIPMGTDLAGFYHTHAGYDPDLNPQISQPGQKSYRWEMDFNENFSPDDKDIVDRRLGTVAFLGTPGNAFREYVPLLLQPRMAPTTTLNYSDCGCPK